MKKKQGPANAKDPTPNAALTATVEVPTTVMSLADPDAPSPPVATSTALRQTSP